MFTTYDNFQTLDSSLYSHELIDDPDQRSVFTKCTFGGGDTIFAHGSFFQQDTLNLGMTYSTIMRSVDGGKSWSNHYKFPTKYLSRIRYLSSVSRDTIFAGGGDSRYILISTDRGISWKPDSIMIDTNYETAKCFGVEMSNDGHPIAIFGQPGIVILSVIARGKYVPTKVEGIERIAHLTSLSPNPTRSKLSIRSIDKNRPGVIITDILGRDVMHSRLDADGNATMDVSSLASGLYFVKLNHFGIVFIVGKVAVID
jgi:hypothetical protein